MQIVSDDIYSLSAYLYLQSLGLPVPTVSRPTRIYRLRVGDADMKLWRGGRGC